MNRQLLRSFGTTEQLRELFDKCRSEEFRRSTFRLFLQTFFQERCRTCSNSISLMHTFGGGDVQCVCEDCWKDLTTTWLLGDELATCRISKELTQSNDWSVEIDPTELVVSSAVQYEKQVKKLVRRFKFDDDRLLAHDFSLLMNIAWNMLMVRLETNFDSVAISDMILAPVPLSRKRLKERGFNQSLVLSKLLSKNTGVPVRSNALNRTKATKPQSGLSREERIKNVEAAFRADSDVVRGKHVVLIDDVCTSGATLVSCAIALRDAGASGVRAVTIARALKKSF